MTSIPHRRPISAQGGRRPSPGFFAGSGLTFWGQWAMAMMLVLLLLFELANRLTGQIGPPYRVLAVLGSVPVYSLLRVHYKH
jgi:putative colanic acid biosynthesis UDP-glucose lipid carrier transferase